MTKKFVSEAMKPNLHERELLVILMEECAEVQQRVAKLLRFGATDVQSGQPHDNAHRLGLEIGDVLEMVSRVIGVGLTCPVAIEEGRGNKSRQLEIYMQTAVHTSPPDRTGLFAFGDHVYIGQGREGYICGALAKNPAVQLVSWHPGVGYEPARSALVHMSDIYPSSGSANTEYATRLLAEWCSKPGQPPLIANNEGAE